MNPRPTLDTECLPDRAEFRLMMRTHHAQPSPPSAPAHGELVLKATTQVITVCGRLR